MHKCQVSSPCKVFLLFNFIFFIKLHTSHLESQILLLEDGVSGAEGHTVVIELMEKMVKTQLIRKTDSLL